MLNTMAAAIDNYFQGEGFALFIFPLDAEPTKADYVSNVQREDMIEALREWLARQDAKTRAMH